MARKLYSDEQVLKLLCEVDFHVPDGLDVVRVRVAKLRFHTRVIILGVRSLILLYRACYRLKIAMLGCLKQLGSGWSWIGTLL